MLEKTVDADFGFDNEYAEQSLLSDIFVPSEAPWEKLDLPTAVIDDQTLLSDLKAASATVNDSR